MKIGRYVLLPAVCLLMGCDMADFSDEETGGDATAIVPTGHGKGTQKQPYTPDELLGDENLPYDEEVWMMGYVVGSTLTNMENAVFDADEAYEHNILLSSDSLCADAADCVAVELTTSKMRQRFSLVRQPGRFRQFIVVRGTLGTYFSQAGIRKADAAYWIDGFDLSRIAPPPLDWDVVNKDF